MTHGISSPSMIGDTERNGWRGPQRLVNLADIVMRDAERVGG
jgi:hypothetical protein